MPRPVLHLARAGSMPALAPTSALNALILGVAFAGLLLFVDLALPLTPIAL
jgi:hypothetical protein